MCMCCVGTCVNVLCRYVCVRVCVCACWSANVYIIFSLYVLAVNNVGMSYAYPDVLGNVKADVSLLVFLFFVFFIRFSEF